MSEVPPKDQAMTSTASAASAPAFSLWRVLGRSAGMRIIVLPVSAILGILNTRLIIEHYGQASYAQYALLVGIGSLLPFADLGISAAIMNSVSAADDPSADDRVRRTLITSLRILAGSTLVFLLLTLVIAGSGAWPVLLGEGLISGSGAMAASLCLATIGITLLVGFGQRILAGLGLNHVSIALLGLQTPFVLATLLLMVHFNTGGGSYVAVVPYVVTFLISAVATWMAARKIRPMLGRALRDAPKIRRVRGGHVFDTAWPMLIQMIALPIAMQTDRLVLSHVSDLKNLSEYSLASQMFTPVWAVVNAAGVALWPIFARARAKQSAASASPIRLSYLFGATAAGVCVILSLASGWLANAASEGTIHLGLGLLVTFSVFMVFQAAKYPLGMYMTDARGLRYQAYMVLLLLPLNLGISLPLAAHFGAVGPVVGSAISVLLCQLVANWVYVTRDLRRVDAARAAGGTGAPEHTGRM